MSEYLAIDGWEEFQKYRGRRAGFILDATDQFERRKLTGLSMFARGVLQELRRLRGRTGENILYDISHIALATHTITTDRPHLQHALDTLIARGLLLVTDQQDNFAKPGEIEKENKKEKKPSAKTSSRGSLKPPTDPRFQHCVDILHRYWTKFISEKIKFEIWMDKAGYRQLKNSLRRSDALSVEEFTRCVANRARSPGVNHFEPAYKWLGHVTDWVGGPKTNGAGQQVSKATAREQRIIDSAVRAAAAGADSGESPDPLALPGDGGT